MVVSSPFFFFFFFVILGYAVDFRRRACTWQLFRSTGNRMECRCVGSFLIEITGTV